MEGETVLLAPQGQEETQEEEKVQDPSGTGRGTGSEGEENGPSLLTLAAQNYVDLVLNREYHTIDDLDDVIEDTLSSMDTIHEHALSVCAISVNQLPRA